MGMVIDCMARIVYHHGRLPVHTYLGLQEKAYESANIWAGNLK